MNLNPEYPVVIAFAGNAGAGKTTTANMIVPSATYVSEAPNKPAIVWNHLFFAMPIYEMISIKTQTEGVDVSNRMLFGLHDIVYDLLQRRCSYDDLIELVYDLYHFPCPIVDGDKPRDFMQGAGDLCLALYDACFAERAIRSINQDFQRLSSEYDKFDEEAPIHFNIISDMRMLNELAIVKEQPNNMVIKFVADQPELDRRIIERSGRPLTAEQKDHKTESQLALIPDDEYDLIVNTTTLTLQDQAAMVKEAICSAFGILSTSNA